MPIRVTCPSCSAALSVRDENAGRAVKCPKCDGVIPVPTAPAPPPAPAAPPPPPTAFNDLDEPAPKRGGSSRSSGRSPARSRRDEDEDEDDRGRDRDDDRDDEDDRPRRRRPSQAGSGLGDFLTFRKMVVPVVIQIIFWFLTLIVVGVGMVFAGISVASGRTEGIAIGLAGLFVGVPLYVLLIRMYCEVLIVIFRMNDTLTDIRNLLDRRND